MTIQTHFQKALLLVASLAAVPTISMAQPPRYDIADGAKASYQYNIEVDRDDYLTQLKGTVHYSSARTEDGSVRLEYSGGLAETVKPNPESSRGGFPRVPIPIGPSRLAIRGLTSNRNVVELAANGEVKSRSGDSQLPFLLGNLSLFPFERLADDDSTEWKSSSQTSIRRINSIFPNFVPMPFGLPGREADEIRDANERIQYRVLKTDEDVLLVEKTYRLQTSKSNRVSYRMTGKGEWTFDRLDHFPKSSEMQYELTISEGNTTTKIPIKLQFHKLTAEQVETNARLAKEQAEQTKRLAESPFPDEEIASILADLNSTEVGKKHMALHKLIQRKPATIPPQLLESVRKIVKSSDGLQIAADMVLRNWDPVYKLTKTYDGPGFIASSNRKVKSIEELHPQMIVQVSHGNVWYAAEIERISGDNQVEIRYRGWNGRLESVPLDRIQLAHEEIEQARAE